MDVYSLGWLPGREQCRYEGAQRNTESFAAEQVIPEVSKGWIGLIERTAQVELRTEQAGCLESHH